MVRPSRTADFQRVERSAGEREGENQPQNRHQSAESAPHQPHFQLQRVDPRGEGIRLRAGFGDYFACRETSRSSLVRAASAFSPAIIFASSTAA